MSSDGHHENLERASARIGRAVIAFVTKIGVGKRFHADELRRFVLATTGILAPASADRILRLLRQTGRIDYWVVSRRESLYEVIRTEPKETEPTTVIVVKPVPARGSDPPRQADSIRVNP